MSNTLNIGVPQSRQPYLTTNFPMVGGPQGELVNSDLHPGKTYNTSLTGRAFTGSLIGSGGAVPIFNTTSLLAGLWNPSGSGIYAVIKRINFGHQGSTNGVPGNLQLGFAVGAGATVATGAVFTVNTAGAWGTDVQPAVLGSTQATTNPKAIFFKAATLTTAMTVYCTLGFSILTTTSTATFGFYDFEYVPEGEVILPPGTAVAPLASAATGTLYNQSITWYEVPVPN